MNYNTYFVEVNSKTRITNYYNCLVDRRLSFSYNELGNGEPGETNTEPACNLSNLQNKKGHATFL